MNRVMCTALLASGALMLSASPSVASVNATTLPSGCAVLGGTVAGSDASDQFLATNTIMSFPLNGKLPYTAKVMTPLRPADASEMIEFFAIDTKGGLWHTTYKYETGGGTMTSKQLATQGYGGIMALVASEYRAVPRTRYVYATTNVGTLVKYGVTVQPDQSWKVTRIGQFKSQGWNTIRSMGMYYATGVNTADHRDYVLALGTDGQLRRYGIPATTESVLRTVLKPSGWQGINHVQGSLCKGGRDRVDGAVLAYTNAGEARVYHDVKAADENGADIDFANIAKGGFAGIHY